MRFYILRALLVKEIHRHLLNRGGLALGLLLVVAAILLSVFNPGAGAGGTGGGSLVGGVHRCLIQYPEEDPFVRSLRASVPADLRPHVVFQQVRPDDVHGLVKFEPGVAAIQVRVTHDPATRRPVKRVFWVWHPPDNPAAMAAYEAWFLKAARNAMQQEAAASLGNAADQLTAPDPGTDDLWAVRDSYRQLAAQVARISGGTAPPVPEVEVRRDGLAAQPLDLRTAIATGMVVFALYFTCVYLLPTLNCEERERGVLLAQALSPASPAEILTAKFLFYPAMGMTLAAVLAGIYKPAVLSTLYFWLALGSVSAGFLGIGMTVATLAKTQRAAFMGSMCYLLSVALIILICQQNGLSLLPWLAIEFHTSKVIHAAITQKVEFEQWGHLLAIAVLAGCWLTAAGWLFRRRGWQ